MSMMRRYRGHLILVKTYQEPDGDSWRVSVRVQFNESQMFRDVLLPQSTARFTTEKRAEMDALKAAKQWIDHGFVKPNRSPFKAAVRVPKLDKFSYLWFTVAIVGFCAVIALVAGYFQKARLSEKASHNIRSSYRTE
jgi:uncharacterized membrane protein YukC